MECHKAETFSRNYNRDKGARELSITLDRSAMRNWKEEENSRLNGKVVTLQSFHLDNRTSCLSIQTCLLCCCVCTTHSAVRLLHDATRREKVKTQTPKESKWKWKYKKKSRERELPHSVSNVSGLKTDFQWISCKYTQISHSVKEKFYCRARLLNRKIKPNEIAWVHEKTRWNLFVRLRFMMIWIATQSRPREWSSRCGAVRHIAVTTRAYILVRFFNYEIGDDLTNLFSRVFFSTTH